MHNFFDNRYVFYKNSTKIFWIITRLCFITSVKYLLVWESRSLCPFMNMGNARKRHKWSLYGSLSSLHERKLRKRFFSGGSGKKLSGLRIGMFFSKAAKNLTLVINLNLHFVFWRSWVHCSTISIFPLFIGLLSSLLVQSNWDVSDKYCFHVLGNIDINQSQCFEEQTPVQCWF